MIQADSLQWDEIEEVGEAEGAGSINLSELQNAILDIGPETLSEHHTRIKATSDEEFDQTN